MAYRETIAWVSLIAMLIAYGPYFALVAAFPPDEGMPNLRQLGLFAAAAIIHMTLMLAGWLWARRQSPDEAAAPPDERERAIAQRAMTLAYFVLIGSVVMVGIVMPFYATGWTLVNAAVFAIVLAETVNYASTVLAYRKQT
jgi:hypothetical protein